MTKHKHYVKTYQNIMYLYNQRGGTPPYCSFQEVQHVLFARLPACSCVTPHILSFMHTRGTPILFCSNLQARNLSLVAFKCYDAIQNLSLIHI